MHMHMHMHMHMRMHMRMRMHPHARHVHIHPCPCAHVRAAHRNDLIEACALEQLAQLRISEVLGAHALVSRKAR